MMEIKCCCGCSLETGSKIIGFLNLIIDSFSAFFGFYNILNTAKDAGTNEEPKIIIQTTSLELYTLVEVFLGIYLLYGLYKNELHCVRAWVIIQIVFLAVSILSEFILIYLQYYVIERSKYATPSDLLSQIFLNIILTGFHVYSILVIHSYEVSRRGSETLYSAS